MYRCETNLGERKAPIDGAHVIFIAGVSYRKLRDEEEWEKAEYCLIYFLKESEACFI